MGIDNDTPNRIVTKNLVGRENRNMVFGVTVPVAPSRALDHEVGGRQVQRQHHENGLPVVYPQDCFLRHRFPLERWHSGWMSQCFITHFVVFPMVTFRPAAVSLVIVGAPDLQDHCFDPELVCEDAEHESE